MNQRKLITAAAGCLLVAAGVTVSTPALAATSCEVVYAASPWTEGSGQGGFTANITVRNTGDPLNGWTLTYTLPSGQTIGMPGWGATWTQTGQNVSGVPLDWNRNLGTGASTGIGYNGRWTGAYSSPTAFSINGVACNGPGGGNQLPTVSLTSPTAGQSFPAGSAVPLAATASDPDGTIANVAFLIDNTVVNTDTTSPYSFSATGLTAGNHTALARATDNSGGTRDSAPIQFTVGTTGTPSIVLSPVAISVAEGGTASLNVKLSQAPAANVAVTLSKTGDADITVAPTTVTLTPANATTTGVNVTVSAAQDADQTNGTATISAAATGVTGASVTATEVDDDVPTGTRVNNPYAGATGYVNPEWRARANAEPGGSRISNNPTGVWLDRIAAIAGANGAMGLRAHLNEALAQDTANGANPLYIQIVIYDLPGRDCAALASNGELGPNDLPRYQTEYIDPIAAIMGEAQYRSLRIVTIIEIDSLPNLVTNISGRPTATPQCDVMNQNGGYVNGVGYALRKLAAAGTYNYIDAAHHGWIGWSDNFGATANKLLQAANANGSTPANVHGFITNTANYSALSEPFINVQGTINGQQVRQSAWVDFNNYNDELSFAAAFRQQLVSVGFTGGGTDGIGMLIDTSRNGWGNCVQAPCEAMPNRPTAASTSTDLNTNINQSRIDRRIHKGNWCNQTGAGLGERPRANPSAGIDAYVWIKPPGESDGSSTEIPNNEGKGFDRMCDPTYGGNARNGNSMSGALAGSPLSGAWFSAQFRQLMANAFPAL